MHIAGAGSIAAGVYDEALSISGSGRLMGDVRCLAFDGSGSIGAVGNLDCDETAEMSGSVRIEGSLTAKKIDISGSCGIDGDCTANEEMRVSGSIRCGGNFRAMCVRCFGSVSVCGHIEAERVHLAGGVSCHGGIGAAESIEIETGANAGRAVMLIAKEITVKRERRQCLLSRLFHRRRCFAVSEKIEGDKLALDGVKTPLVIGESVKIGKHCDIDCVRYSESIDIHSKAKVGKVEKI